MNIDDIKNRLLIKYPLFGSVVANSTFIEDERIDTAGTDGKNIYYNSKFLEKLTEEQQIFIMAHEVCHIAFNHVYRGKDKDKKIWNIATDSVINALLENEGLHMVEGVVNIPEAINYDAEEMYNKLLEEKKKQEEASNENNSSNKQNSNENNSNSNQEKSRNNNQKEQKSSDGENSNNENNPFERDNNDVGHDTHSLWDKALEQNEQENSETKDNEGNNSSSEQKQSENNNENDLNEKGEDKDNKEENSRDNNQKEQKSSYGKNSNSELNKKVEEQIKKMAHLGERKIFKQNKIERKKQLQELRELLAKQSQGYGTNTNSNSRKINNIGTSEQLIDWRLVLKEAIQYDIDWSFENATIEDGVVTPHLEEKPFSETEIVLDTSGSIDEDLLRNFLRECKNILQTSKVKIGCFDTKFYGFVEIKDITDIDNLEFYGGGGTNFDVAVNAFSRRVENKIIFTDGEANMPEKTLDAIWIVFGNRKINPKGGKVIYIDDIELKRLQRTKRK